MSGRDQFAWLTLAGVLLLVAWLTLDRVQNEKLFLFALPFDRAPFAVEVSDASAATRIWTIPALAFLAVANVAVAVSQRVGPIESVRRHWPRVCALVERHPGLCVLFGVASAADFVSTLMYFHSHRIDDELHPGIKLVTYAYRTYHRMPYWEGDSGLPRLDDRRRVSKTRSPDFI